ncbi:hypothetical protein AB0B01_05530 [Streptomyces sp. NPDC044571]
MCLFQYDQDAADPDPEEAEEARPGDPGEGLTRSSARPGAVT